MKVVRISNLHKAEFPYWRYDGPVRPDWVVRDGDLLFSWAGVASSVDVYLYQGETALLNQHIYNFYVPDVTRKLWVFFWLQFRLPKLREEIEVGAGQLHLTKAKIQAIAVPVPHADELRLLLDRIQAIHEQTVQNEHFVTQLEMQKQGLMDDLLSGRVRVPAMEAEEVIADG